MPDANPPPPQPRMLPSPLSIAIGFTVVEDGDSPEAVLDRADEAMYVQKDAA